MKVLSSWSLLLLRGSAPVRISDQTRFPHPVLAEETGDYTEGSFSVELRVSESRTTGNVTVEYSVQLVEPQVEGLLKDGQALAGLFIVCRRTYYNELHSIPLGEGRIEFRRGELRDAVVLRPVICAVQDIDGFTSPNLHEEFGGIDWAFRPSDVLALGAEVLIDVGLDKLAPMETIFDLVESDEVPSGETRVQLDSEEILICADKQTCRGIHAMRGSGAGRVALLNGVYLPVLMEVLGSIAQDSAACEDRRWFGVFSAKCSQLEINLDKIDTHADAQKLLRAPLGKLLGSKEFNPS